VRFGNILIGEKLKPDGTKDIRVVCIACGDELAGAPIAGIIHLKRHHTRNCKLKGQIDIRNFQ
jgi:hypothetical protein